MFKLNIYKFELLNKQKEQMVLSFYNEEEDFINTVDDFLTFIHKNIRDYIDNQGKYRTFTLAKQQVKDEKKRIIYGYFDSAYTGEKGKIKDRNNNKVKYQLKEFDLYSKDFFFLIHIPKGAKYGFLIVQRKENHGVKSIFETAFNNFMRFKGVSNYQLIIKQAPPKYVIKNFLNEGKLKEFRLIDNLPNFKVNNNVLDLIKEEKVFKFKNFSNQEVFIKQTLVDVFSNHKDTNKICFLDKGEFDEISFVLEYKGNTKTFYIKNREKIKSNIDLSDETKNLNEIQLVEKCLDLLKVA